MAFHSFQNLPIHLPVLLSSGDSEHKDRCQGNTIPANPGRPAKSCAAFSVNALAFSNVKV